MANNGNVGKKNGAGSAGRANQAPETSSPTRRDNLFARHGNQQISEAITAAQNQQQQQGPTSVLQAAEAETEQITAQTPEWASTDQSRQEDEETQILRRTEEAGAEQEKPEARVDSSVASKLTESSSPDKKVDDLTLHRLTLRGSEASALLAGADAAQLAEAERVQKQRGGTLGIEDVMLAMATAHGIDEEEKAEMLLSRGDVDEKALEGQSGELRTLVTADKLPPELSKFAKNAAADTSNSPLSERDTLKNVMDRIRMITQQMGNHPQLTDPKASVEEKATRLVELLAYELDVPTRESVAAHSYQALLEDMIFDPQGIMEVNRIAGNRRDVRTIGSFGVVLWQLARDAVQGRLEQLDDKTQINETDFLANIYSQMATDMYTDGMQKPSGV